MCHAPTFSHLSISLQVCTSPWQSVSLKSVPTCLVRRNCVLGLRCGGDAGKHWEERDPLPGKHTSTCENMFPFREMCPGPWAGKFPGRPGMHRSPPFPLAGNLCCLWKAGGLQGEHASPDLCHGGETCFSGWRGSEVQGACDFLAVAQASPCIVWCGQGSLYVNTSLPGSPGGGVGRRQRQEGTGFWGTKA